LKSPADMKIIQIDITNACTKRCSNCTRFCGNHRKPFMMDFETFKKAVDSMEGFPGIVGVMGGEPTLHPEFEKFAEYFASKFGKGGVLENAREPVTDFNAHIVRDVFDIDNSNRRGLWSIMGKRYYEHYELIQETFGYQAINDHVSESEHAALLISRKELGIPDDEWIKMRDDCWIQNRWSASIHPKGAFFCEVAAALDATFDGPGGWPIEKGWWKRKPEDFKEQLQWCEMCAACLKVPSRNANAEIDDVSPAAYEKLVAIRSPKIKQKLINIVPVANPAGGTQDKVAGRKVESNTWYLPDGDQLLRIGPTNRSIYPKRFDAILLCEAPGQPGDFDAVRPTFDDVASLTRGEDLNDALTRVAFSDWCALTRPGAALPPDLVPRLREVVLNPGCLYYIPAGNAGEPRLILFNKLARSLRGHLPRPFPADGDLAKFMQHWPDKKRIVLRPDFDKPEEAGNVDAIDQLFEKIRSDYAWIAKALPPVAGERVLRLGRWAHATTKRVHRYLQRDAARRT
jgi:hypothetical protein